MCSRPRRRPCGFSARGQHADRGFIGMQNTVFQQSIFNASTRLQLHTTGTHPFGRWERGISCRHAEHAFLTAAAADGRHMLGHQHRASRPAVGMPLSITCGGTGADQRLSRRPICPGCTFNVGTVAKLAMRQPLSYSKALHFKNSAYQRISPVGSP